MVLTSGSEYVCNIATMLFNMTPGTDKYDVDKTKGLQLEAKRFRTFVENYRDTEYESEIVRQFSTYTDLIPLNVVAVYMNSTYLISMRIKYENQVYAIEVNGNTNTLNAMLINT